MLRAARGGRRRIFLVAGGRGRRRLGVVVARLPGRGRRVARRQRQRRGGEDQEQVAHGVFKESAVGGWFGLERQVFYG